MRLLEAAVKTGSWFDLPEKLNELRANMKMQVSRSTVRAPTWG